MKFPILFFVLLTLTSASAQQVNHYGTDFGFADQLRPSDIRPPSFAFSPPPTFDSVSLVADSNALSSLSIALGSKRYDVLETSLMRQLNPTNSLSIQFNRASTEGWMLNSAQSRTRVAIRLAGKPHPRVAYNIQGNWNGFQTGLNGGLMGRNYTAEVVPEADFVSYYTDVWMNDERSLSKSNDLKFASTISYRLSDSAANTAVEAQISSAYSFHDFEVVFSAGDVAYAQHFNSAWLGDFRDRWQRSSFTTALSFPLKFRSLGLALAPLAEADQSWLRFNGQHKFNVNLSAGAFAKWVLNATSLQASASNVVSGYNKGDFEYALHWASALNASDSDTAVLFKASGRYVSRRPFLMFTDYNSQLVAYSNVFETQQSGELKVGLEGGSRRLDLGASVGTRSETGYLTFDSTAQARQFDSPFLVPFVEAQSALNLPRWKFGLSPVIQFSSNAAAFDVPRFLCQGYLGHSVSVGSDVALLDFGLRGQFFSAYRARGYLAHLNAFYFQTQERFGPYTQIDLVLAARVGAVSVNVEWLNALFGIVSTNPLVGPGYIGVPRYLRAGLTWHFRN